MFKNYITTTLRILWREKVYGLINIIGLSLGVSCSLIIALYLNNEFSYDKHHESRDQIFRIAEEQYRNGEFFEFSANVGGLVGPYLKQDYPEVLEYVRFSGSLTEFFRYEDQITYEDNVHYADNSVFDVFTHNIISGDPESALLNPASIAISQSFADRYFGDEDPLGKVLSTEADDFLVTLVFQDIPQTSHYRYDALISIESLFQQFEPNLTANVTNTYLKMVEGYEAESFQAIWAEFEQRHMEGLRGRGYTGDQLFLEPLSDIYLQSGVVSASTNTANVFSLYAFAAIGILILLVASVNYMNLATARSIKRVKEIAVRKLLGAEKRQLIIQLLGESAFLSLLSVLLSLGVVEFVLAIEFVSNAIGQNLSLRALSPLVLVLGTVALVAFLGVLVGLYPAYYISTNLTVLNAHKNTSVEKGNYSQNALVGFQFTISIAVIAMTLLMFSQIRFIQDRELGFDKEDKVLVSLWGADAIENGELFFDELLAQGAISGVAYTARGRQSGIFAGGEWPVGIPGTPFNEWREFNRIYVDENFFELMGVEVTRGRNFNAAISTDREEAALINETALREMGWNEPLGQNIGIAFNPATVVGVIDDFHVRALHQSLRPTVVSLLDMEFGGLSDEERKSLARTAVIDVGGVSVSEFLSILSDSWPSIDPAHPLDYQFLEDQLNRQYAEEQKQLQLFIAFSAICIFVSCLGLLGLSSYSTERRTKEIGIRKVLGASVLNIIFQLFRTTLFLLIGAALLASIGSFWASSQWLQRFYYQIEIDPSVFLLATCITTLIAFVTVSSQAYRTAITNPVEALRYE